MGHYDFRKDLENSRKTEQEVADILLKRYGTIALIGTCDNGDYDLKFRNEPGSASFTVEVKEDMVCESTGFVGVEFECRGKPSGIDTSKADMFAYKLHCPDGVVRFYSIGKFSLKRMIADLRFERVAEGGDPGSNTRMYLFNLDFVEKNFMFLGEYPKEGEPPGSETISRMKEDR